MKEVILSTTEQIELILLDDLLGGKNFCLCYQNIMAHHVKRQEFFILQSFRIYDEEHKCILNFWVWNEYNKAEHSIDIGNTFTTPKEAIQSFLIKGFKVYYFFNIHEMDNYYKNAPK